jgi:hypothetical protein
MLEYENLNLSQIKELCGERHLSKEGTKADLLERIKEYEERQVVQRNLARIICPKG